MGSSVANIWPRIWTSGLIIGLYLKVRRCIVTVYACHALKANMLELKVFNHCCIGRGLCACGQFLWGELVQRYYPSVEFEVSGGAMRLMQTAFPV